MENIIGNWKDIQEIHKAEHEKYEYKKRILTRGAGIGCEISVYEVPPLKAAYPYHTHMEKEEFFFILKGTGLLRTPEGEQKVSQGDFMYFTTGEKGSHQLRNLSDTENLIYIDFGTNPPLDACFYPDSDKIGIFGKNFSQLYYTEDQKEYYDGE